MRRSIPLLAATMLVVALAAPAFAGVPALPPISTIPACLTTTPAGNIVSVVIVRDLANNPVSNCQVVIDYNNCPGFSPCPAGALPDGYVVDPVAKTIRMTSGPNGQAPFYLRAGGGCSGNGIRIFADGILLGSIHAASADQNGDHSVDGADVAAVHAKIGSADLSGDLDCNGVVNAVDEGIVVGYVGVNCSDPTETHQRTWGSLKTIYR